MRSTFNLGGAIFGFLLHNSFIYGTIVLSVDSRTVRVRTTLASAFVSPGIFGCFRSSPPRENDRFVNVSLWASGSDPCGAQLWLVPSQFGGPLSRASGLHPAYRVRPCINVPKGRGASRADLSAAVDDS